MDFEDFEIARAGVADALLLSRLQAQTWRESYGGIVADSFLDQIDPLAGARVLLEQLGQEEFEFYLLRAGGEAVGRLTLAKTSPATGEIEALYLLRAAQGRGFGRRAMDFALARLAALGCGAVGLWVMAQNTGAVAFYEQMGFTRTGEGQTELDGKFYPKLRYVLEL